jgi:aryl-phospho-beta-D-glucosidase BglC (GH1 family)
VPGSQLYSGAQQHYIKKIATHAIQKYGMHVVLDVHSLPGGVNGLTTGEATFHWGWFNNETAFGYTMQAADAVIDFIQNSGCPESYSFAPINEPCDNQNLLTFGQPSCLTENGASWILKYINAVLDRLAEANPRIPVMFQGSFKGESYWSGNFSKDTNIVFDVHNYYFIGRLTTSKNLPSFICEDAKASPGDGKFPVIVGEWAIQAALWNSFDLRKRNLNVGLWAFRNWTQGSMMWTAKYPGTNPVLGEGTQEDYWSFETFVELGYVNASEGEGCC